MHQNCVHGSIGLLATSQAIISIVVMCSPNVSVNDDVSTPNSGGKNQLLFFSDVGAVPARGTGLHRYVFLLFEQNGGRRDFKESLITNE